MVSDCFKSCLRSGSSNQNDYRINKLFHSGADGNHGLSAGYDGERLSCRQYSEHPHEGTLLRGLDELRKHGLLCDVKLVVEGSEFNAHRAVLASCSSYFRSMFTTSMIEKEKGKIIYFEVCGPYGKVGCVLPMVVVSILLRVEFGPNDHRKDSPDFIRVVRGRLTRG